MFAQLGVAYPKRWDEYLSLACWIKRSLPDPMLPNKTPLERMFDRKPCILCLDTILGSQIYHMNRTGGLDYFVENTR